jgi:hypothetical protein
MATEPQKDKPADGTAVGASAGQVLAGNVKWIVAGVIALVGMVLFKEPLTKLLDRAENVEITATGVKVSTVKTPLGDTVVSNKGVQPTAAGTTSPGQAGKPSVPGAGFQTTRDQEAGFAISWPSNGRWSSQPETARQFGARLLLANPAASRGDFVPNVNVVVTRDAAGVDVAQYLGTTARILTGLGWEVTAQQADTSTQSGVLVTVNRQMGTAQIQRVVLRNGLSYVITASRADGDNREDLYAAMGQILNSFELI